MTKRQIITLGVVFLTILLINPLFASDELNFKSDNLNQLLDEVVTVFNPVITENTLTITNNIPEGIAVTDKDLTGESVMTLICNAIVRAPKDANIQIGYENGKLSIWVPKTDVAYAVKTQVTSASGQTFDYNTMVGKGFELSMYVQ